MGNVIGKIVEEIIGIIKRNYRKPKLWITIGLLLLIILLLLPSIDSNFFYYSRMEKRIETLQRVMELDQEKINSNVVFKEEYQSILSEIQQQKDYSINLLTNPLIKFVNDIFVIETDEGNRVVKFITGALWCIVITICIPFMNTFKKKGEKFIAFLMFVLLSIIVGMLFSYVPTIITPYVNYIGVPIIQLILVVVLIVKSSTPRNSKNVAE